MWRLEDTWLSGFVEGLSAGEEAMCVSSCS